ncbi:hypothetical protein [Ruegeria profundi]|uniref:hypothetical protein n=1 Tax=Ruegeria profundi TaxID=1685378 RepID=UPI001CD80DEA|nr:hypothetical protein [Ruegeria profundi]MCA0927141.1 hypothetical protein [Ruegeria profundi]
MTEMTPSKRCREWDEGIETKMAIYAEDIAKCGKFFENWLDTHSPLVGPDGRLEKDDYYDARLRVAMQASELLGFPVSTGAVKHWFPRWGYYHTAGQKAKKEAFEAARSKGS